MSTAPAVSTVQLNTGTEIPAIGYGVGTRWFKGKDKPKDFNDELLNSLKSAIQIGFRHLDAAESYGTEEEVGRAVAESGVPREQFFITTKISTAESLKDPSAALERALTKLQTTYVDLFLIHSPGNFEQTDLTTHIKNTWAHFETLHDQGKAKAIGVSNFPVKVLRDLLRAARVKPAVNQIEYHPYLQQDGIVSFCHEAGIKIEAYGPLASVNHKPGGPVDPVVDQIAKRHHKSPAQVLLRFAIQKGDIALTTSSNPERQKQFLDLFDFKLDEKDIESISQAGATLSFRKFWTSGVDWDTK